MELVYLWVKEYKNIKNQGFNFSPKFECSYDEKTKKLIIDENKEYTSILPDNINITAIVGENGSGKSSLINSIITWINDEEYFFIYKVKNENKLFCSSPSNIEIKFPNYNIETIDIKTDKSQSGFYYNFKSIYYSENLFFDDIIGSTDISFKDFLFKNIDYKSSDKTFELAKILTKKILQLLKRDIKAIPIEFKSYYLEVDFHYDISKTNLYKDLEKYKNDNIYTIPFDEFTIFEKLTNELYSFDVLFKYNKNYKNIPSLPSQGEISLLYLLSSIYNELISILKEDENDHKDFYGNNILLILDEPVNSFHPQWQKKFIYFLTNFLKENFSYIEFHIIITSHSPFILSDLPKENVIFLKKDENGNCKNVSYKIDINQTFGANIHTLLSHGFFMEDGLMGEFAKNKITEVIQILKKTQLSEDEIKECKHIISIIGEPILQKTLEHQLNAKLNPNETELQKLEREKEEIQEKIAKLTGKTNETN